MHGSAWPNYISQSAIRWLKVRDSLWAWERADADMFLNTFDELRNRTINFPQVDDMEEPYFCPGGHVNQKAHNELAERIIKVLK